MLTRRIQWRALISKCDSSLSYEFILLAVFSCLACSGCASTEQRRTAPSDTGLRVGSDAPELSLEKLLQAPDRASATWETLRGKVVVLEFWATWCGPCLSAIPFLNVFEEQFEGKPVQFISITDEPESVIKPFLKKTPMRGWIGLDTDGSAFKAYNISSLPTTVVVDQHGKLVGWTFPSTLIEHPDILDDLLAGKTRQLSRTKEAARWSDLDQYFVPLDLGRYFEDIAEAREQFPRCLILIKPAGKEQPSGLLAVTSRRYALQAASIRSAVAWAYDVPIDRIVIAAPLLDDRKYDVIFYWPKGPLELGRVALQQAIVASFGVNVRRERRAMDVYVLQVPEGTTPTLELSMNRVIIDEETGHRGPTREALAMLKSGETLFMAMGGMPDLASNLGYVLGRPVVDETDIEGNYVFFFPYDDEKDDSGKAIDALQEKYSLSLVPARRDMEVLIVEKASEQ